MLSLSKQGAFRRGGFQTITNNIQNPSSKIPKVPIVPLHITSPQKTMTTIIVSTNPHYPLPTNPFPPSRPKMLFEKHFQINPMTKYEIAQHTRDENISAHLDANKAIILPNVKLHDAAVEFIANTQKKKTFMAELSVTTEGYTASKAEAREELTENLLDICNIGTAYAHDIGDDPMLQLMNTNKWEIGRLNQEFFDSFAAKVIKMADDNKIPMADYGLTIALLTEAKENHTDYKNAKPLPAEIEGKITSINNSIDNLQDKNDKLLVTKLEKLIPLFRVSHTEYVDTFHALNKITNPPVKHTQVHAIITDANGNPLPNVTLTFQNQNNTFKILTGPNGEITQQIPFGTYDITLSKEGSQSVELKEIKIKKGQTNKIIHKMS